MKVALYRGPKDVVIEDRPQPKAGPGEAVVKVKYCGICGTDVHSYLHPGVIEPPTIFGHETVGTIAELGPGADGWKVGDRVAVGPPGNCGECYNCLQGRASICLKAFPLTTGISPNTDGGYAEYLLARNAKNMLLKIPENVPFEEAVLFDVLGTAFHAIRRSRFRAGDTVAVVGSGPIGLCAIMLLRLAGAMHITAIERSEVRAKLALQYGADLALNPEQEGAALADKLRAIGGGKGPDIVFECAGAPQAIQTSIAVVRNGGEILVVGVAGEPTSLVTAQLVPREVNLTTSFVYDAEEIAMILGLLANGRLPLAKNMVTDTVGLKDVVSKGLERLATSSGQIKILLDPWL